MATAQPSNAAVDSHLRVSRSSPLARFFLGAETDPPWARPALWGLLVVAAVLYLWDVSISGYANDFYAAAVKSGTESTKAWLFGSLDSGNAITVDKPPAAMWVMVLSSRIFGFSSFSMLFPQALMGVGTVALVHASVRRVAGHAAGLLAGGLVVLTPVAALMFRFNNPDALLVLLMTAAAYFVVRSLENDSGKRALGWLVAAGVTIGFAFLAKMLQGLLVVPGMALAYLIAAQRPLLTRIWHLLVSGAAIVVSAGWYVLLVSLWPASDRPYIGGSTNNSLWQLAIGYNGLSRIFGGSGNGGGGGRASMTGGTGAAGRAMEAMTGAAGGSGSAAAGEAARIFGGGAGRTGGGGMQNAGFGGSTGIFRMFGASFGTEISWLLPATLLLLVAGLICLGRISRTDRVRASLVMWGGWVIVTGLVFSFMEGTVHPYYTIALAPGIAAAIAIGATTLWRIREKLWARCILAIAMTASAAWGAYLMHRYAPDWLPWLKWVAGALAVVGAMAFVAIQPDGTRGHSENAKRLRMLAIAGVITGMVGGLGATASWTVATASTAHSGSIPTSGPSSAAGIGGMGGFGGGAGLAGRDRMRLDGRARSAAYGGRPDAADGAPGGGTSGARGTEAGPGTGAAAGELPSGISIPSGAGAGGMGGGQTNAALVKLLNATNSRWSAAVIGAQSADGYILYTHTAVMAIGGFTGSDPSPTLAQFKAYVAAGDIHYFIAGGGMGGMGGDSTTASQITSWVEANFKATTVGGVTVYDLSTAK